MNKIFRYIILLKYFLKRFTKRKVNDTLIIIKIEAIGDYLVFRNCLKAIRESRKYRGYKITFVGNALWKDVAIKFDSSYADTFIWITPSDLNTLSERRRIFDEVSSKRYKQLITFHYSRSLATENLSFVIIANEKITMNGDCLNIKPNIKKYTDKIYSKIINIPSTIVHEFHRNVFFLSNIVEEHIEMSKPELLLEDLPYHSVLLNFNDYFIIAPGAGVTNRQVSKKTLQDIIEYLLSNKINLCFVGAPSEAEYVNSLIASFESELILNLTGKTTLVELAYIVKKAQAVLCNDSSIFHLGVSLNKKTVCFAGGGHFERFVEYPGVKDIYLCYYRMACFNCDWKCIFNFKNSQRYPCIENLQTKEIKDIITRHLLIK